MGSARKKNKKLSRREQKRIEKIQARCNYVQNLPEEKFESMQQHLLDNSIFLEDHAWVKFLVGILCFIPALLVKLPMFQLFFVCAGGMLLTAAAIQKTMAGSYRKRYRRNKNFRNLIKEEEAKEFVESLDYGQHTTVEKEIVREQEADQQSISEQDNTNNNLGI